MKKTLGMAGTILAAALILAALGARAQQNTAPAGSGAQQGSSASGSSQAPAAKTTSPTATKPRTGTGSRSAAPLALKTDKDKTSYAIGANIGKSMHKDELDIDPNILVRGLRDGIAGGKTLMTDDEIKASLTALQADIRNKQQAKVQALGEANKRTGDAFLAANKTQEGVVTLADGLQYKILQEGTGPKPTPGDSVVCNYRGTLLNNTEFDSSYKRGQPATFPVTGVIKGWTEALQLMPVGSKWQIFVPSELAYGARGAGAEIGPNSTLVFEIELLSIQPKTSK
jgi:FKBP-type peptidyl-prolyl cis-trans isomerase FklB